MGRPSIRANRFALITPVWPATAAAVFPLGELPQSPMANMLEYLLCLMVVFSTSTKPFWSEIGLPNRQSGGPIGGVTWIMSYCNKIQDIFFIGKGPQAGVLESLKRTPTKCQDPGRGFFTPKEYQCSNKTFYLLSYFFQLNTLKRTAKAPTVSRPFKAEYPTSHQTAFKTPSLWHFWWDQNYWSCMVKRKFSALL